MGGRGWGEVEGEDGSMISKLFTCWSRNQKFPILYLLNGDFSFTFFFLFHFKIYFKKWAIRSILHCSLIFNTV